MFYRRQKSILNTSGRLNSESIRRLIFSHWLFSKDAIYFGNEYQGCRRAKSSTERYQPVTRVWCDGKKNMFFFTWRGDLVKATTFERRKSPAENR
jgi:hypothetical protein